MRQNQGNSCHIRLNLRATKSLRTFKTFVFEGLCTGIILSDPKEGQYENKKEKLNTLGLASIRVGPLVAQNFSP